MTKIMDGLLYSKEDEWLRVEGEEGVVGITDYAQDALSDLVYLELPGVGETLSQGEVFGVIESVKAAADLYMPVSGEITAVNEDLPDSPEVMNSDPYGDGWLVRIKISNTGELDDLLDAGAYRAYCESRA